MSTHPSVILIINCGSSSIKMAVLSMPDETTLAQGMVEQVHTDQASLHWQAGESLEHQQQLPGGHPAAISELLAMLSTSLPDISLSAVGHRIVHGGEHFTQPTILDDRTIRALEDIAALAPLHNPANIIGIRAARQALPDIPHVGVFDTAFHHTLPPEAFLYAVPTRWYRDFGLRRYGFHGTSHHYVAQQAAQRIGKPFNACQLLTIHLGNGCSATAVRDGISVDTTMGLTPLEGLVMGTRSGDVDPGLHAFIARQSGMSLDEITAALNKQSGLLGLSGISSDMRTLLEAEAGGDPDAALAINVFCHRLARALGGLSTSLERVDALVFTGGIGEHSAMIRARTVAHLAVFGVELDPVRNMDHGRSSHTTISADHSGIPVLVIPTQEETMIARYVHAITPGTNHE